MAKNEKSQTFTTTTLDCKLKLDRRELHQTNIPSYFSFDKTIPHPTVPSPPEKEKEEDELPENPVSMSVHSLSNAYKTILATNPFIELGFQPTDAPITAAPESFPVYNDPSPKQRKHELRQSRTRLRSKPRIKLSSRERVKDGDILFTKRCKQPRQPEKWTNDAADETVVYDDQISVEERELLIEASPVFRAFFYEMKFETGDQPFRRVIFPNMNSQAFDRLCVHLRTKFVNISDEFQEILQILLSAAQKFEMWELEKQCLYQLQYSH